jgi:murein DD-endopeptidase MepM/ murein hydrolase activator NlpD
MSYPIPPLLTVPLAPYQVGGYHFRQMILRRLVLPAIHLGDDVLAEAGTAVVAAGDGEVVWADIHHGSPERRNWGGLVILGHAARHLQQPFFSLYGHIQHLAVTKGQTVAAGTPLGVIAPANTPDGGFWETPHLHFALYTGPWADSVLPGWWRPEQWRTRLAYWQNPQEFMAAYNEEVA